MTLDFKKMVRNLVKKEAVVHHWEGNVEIFKKGELPEVVTGKIRETFGESFLDDGNYVLFFSAPEISKDVIEKYIFKICNTALGRSANSLVEQDIKILDFGTGPAPRPAPAGSIDKASLVASDSDRANNDAIAGVLGGDLDPEDGVNESVDRPQPGEKFCFLKITMK